MSKIQYTQTQFATPRARVEYSEARIEILAERVVKCRRSSLDDLLDAIDELESELGYLADARRAEEEAT
jgi:hypothetical protein